MVYEYKIATKTYRCDRVSVGENLGNFEVAETLAKYPLGKAVTVYYNPNNRAEALLEREFPSFLWKGVIIIVLVLAGVILGAIFGFKGLGRFLEGITNTANAPFVTACIGFARAVGAGGVRHAARRRAGPAVADRAGPDRDVGRAVVRGAQPQHRRKLAQAGRRNGRPNVVYGYDVAGVHYRGNKISYIRLRVEHRRHRAQGRRPATRSAPSSRCTTTRKTPASRRSTRARRWGSISSIWCR